MKLLSTFLLCDAVNAWAQPNYQTAVRLVNERSEIPWGRPVETRKDWGPRKFSDCEDLPVPANALPHKCQRSTCMLMCENGFSPVGNKRAACRKSRITGKWGWGKSLGECKTCKVPEPISNDPTIRTTCKKNPRGITACFLKCTNLLQMDQFPVKQIKLSCKCPRGKCAWRKGSKIVDFERLTCKQSSATTTPAAPKPITTKQPTTTTTKQPTTTTKKVTMEIIDGSAEQVPEFEKAVPHLTATKSCNADGNVRLIADDSGRIVNGVNARQGYWPWIVSTQFFRFEFGGAGLCGGSILNDRWIISAAHCCRSAVKMIAVVGNFNRNEPDDGQFEVTSRSMFIHPQYQSGNGMDWDACLIKVPSLKAAAPSTCSNCYSAACLPDEAPVHGRHCWVAGWGHTSEGQGLATKLQEVGVHLMDWNYCTSKSTYGEVVNKNVELCAGIHDTDNNGLVDGGKDACQGDSGGPLVCDDADLATLYGLVSWGEGCARVGKPGIYVDVFAIKDWIIATMQN